MNGFTWCTTTSLVRSTNTFFSCLACSQFTDCISCLTRQRILFRFLQIDAFLLFHTCLSFIMSEYVSFLCSMFLPSFHSSVLLQAQQSDPPTHFQSPGRHTIYCLHDLTSQTFLFWFQQTIGFLPVYLCLSLNMSEYVSLQFFIRLQSFHPSVLQQGQQINHGPLTKRVSSIILVCKSNANSHLFVVKHSCLFDPVQVPPTSHLN